MNNLDQEPRVGDIEHSWHCFTCHHTWKGPKVSADIDAGRHARRYPGHQVATRETKIVHVWTVYSLPQLVLDDEPPF